jgi:hypothetical protein
MLQITRNEPNKKTGQDANIGCFYASKQIFEAQIRNV